MFLACLRIDYHSGEGGGMQNLKEKERKAGMMASNPPREGLYSRRAFWDRYDATRADRKESVLFIFFKIAK